MKYKHETSENKLTEKQKRFIEHFLLTGCATQAAKNAGYAAPHNTQGYRLLHNPRFAHVQEEIDKRPNERAEKMKIDAEWLLQELVEAVQVAKASVRPKLNSKTGKPIKDEHGNPVYTRNDQALLKALELIGKHISVGAFKERLEVTTEDALIEKLYEGRRRANARNMSETAG